MMLNKISVATLLAMALAGCDPTMSPEVMAKAKQEKDACNRFTTWGGVVNCMNAVENKYNMAEGDLAKLQQASRVAYAEKVDRGQMSAADANLELAKMSSAIQSEWQRREAAAAAAAASSMPVTCNTNGSYGYVSTTCY